MMNKIDKYFVEVNECKTKDRIDKFLADKLSENLTRSRIQSLIVSGDVQVNDKIITSASYKVKNGDRIYLKVPEAVPTEIIASSEISLNVVYEDDDLLVIDKQAGLTVHPGAGNHQDTMVNALIAHCGDSLSGIGGVQRPGIVHRLDKNTSGLLVVAKHDKAHVSLSEQLQRRDLKRRYIAFVWGAPFPPVGVIENHLDRHHKDRTKRTVVKNGGKLAITHYKVLADYADKQISAVECILDTGRTHQIRVQFKHFRYPLIGDDTYGASHFNLKKGYFNDEEEKFITKFPRQALHSKYISFIHPVKNERMDFESNIDENGPDDLLCLQKILNKNETPC